MHDCELDDDVVKVAAKEALSAIQHLDETSGTTRLDFGKHTGYTYSEIVTRDEQYCQWVRGMSNATGRMASFQSYLTRRWKVEEPIRMVKEVDRLNIERRFKADCLKRKRESEEHRQKMAKARADVLKERMRTSSGTQLVGLSGNIELFEEQVLKRLQLTDLLNIPCVCRSMRDTTNGRGEEWLKTASSAMARRSSLLVDTTQKNRHDEAVKRFFGFPINWILPTICYNSGKLDGFDNYIKLKRDVDDLQRTSYARMRNEVRLAIQNWKAKRKYFETCVCAMSGLQSGFSKLESADARVKSAIKEMSTFFVNNRIKVSFTVGVFDPARIPDWEKMANDANFAFPQSGSHQSKP